MGEEDPASKKLKELLDVHTDNALAALQKHREMTGGDGKRERRKSSSSLSAAGSFTTTTRTTTGINHPSLFVDDDDDNNDVTDDYDSKDRDGITKLLRKFGCVDTALKIVTDNPKSHYDYHNRNHHHHPNNNNNNNNNNNRSILRTQSLKQSPSLSSRNFVIRPPGSSQSYSSGCSSSSRWTTSCGDAIEMGFNTGLKLPIRHASLEEQKQQQQKSSS